jgi:hypothetical protein
LPLPFHRNYAVGAHGGAEAAANALCFVRHCGGRVSLLVDRLSIDLEDLLGACVYAEPAAFTKIRLKRHFCHGIAFPVYVLDFLKIHPKWMRY